MLEIGGDYFGQILRFLGVTGIQVIMRISGILLSSLAVQFIFDGIGQSGLLVQQKYFWSYHLFHQKVITAMKQ
jgi:hypothetical protein